MAGLAIYNIDFTKMLRWLINATLRRTKTFAFFRSLIAPLMIMWSDFLNYKQQVDVELTRTTQVCRLRGSLNDVFDSTLRRILVYRDAGTVILYAYTEAENRPQYLPQYLGTGGVNYIVEVPVALQVSDFDLNLFIARYNLEPLTWRIIYV